MEGKKEKENPVDDGADIVRALTLIHGLPGLRPRCSRPGGSRAPQGHPRYASPREDRPRNRRMRRMDHDPRDNHRADLPGVLRSEARLDLCDARVDEVASGTHRRGRDLRKHLAHDRRPADPAQHERLRSPRRLRSLGRTLKRRREKKRSCD